MEADGVKLITEAKASPSPSLTCKNCKFVFATFLLLVTFDEFTLAVSPKNSRYFADLDQCVVESFGLSSGLQVPYNCSIECVLANFLAMAQFHPKVKDTPNLAGESPEVLLDLVVARASVICVINQKLSGVLEWIDFSKYTVCYLYYDILSFSRHLGALPISSIRIELSSSILPSRKWWTGSWTLLSSTQSKIRKSTNTLNTVRLSKLTRLWRVSV